jgi:hypothetical protein
MAQKEGKKDFFDYLRPFAVKYIKPITDWIFQSRIHAIMVVLTVIFAVVVLKMMMDLVKHVVVISFLILLGGISKIYQRYFKVQIGIEFIMLATVVSGYVYGAFVGGIVGLFTFSLATYFSGRFSHHLVISFVLMTLVGIASSFFTNVSVTAAGIILTLIYNLILIPIYIGFFSGRFTRIFLFSATHIFWNLWVFTALAPYLVNILK